MLFLRLLARALRWRAAPSLAVFVVAVVAVLAAVLGPIYLAAASQVVLTERLQQASPSEINMRVVRTSVPGTPNPDPAADVRSTGAVASRSPWFGPTVVAQSAILQFDDSHHVFTQARIGTVDGYCAHLHFVSGSCPTKPGDAAISVRAAATAGFHVGDLISGTWLGGNGSTATVYLSAIYEPIDPGGPYWSPWTFFDQQPALFQGQVPALDTLFVSSAAIDVYKETVSISTIGIAPFLPDSVRLANENDVRATVAATVAAARAVSGIEPVIANSRVGTVLDAIDHEVSLTRTLVDIATIQLALLVICVLYALVSATATEHSNEVALAKLRGRRFLAVLGQGLLEPIVLVALAAPAGAALAWVVVRAVAPHTLGPLASVGFPGSAVLVAVLTTLAAVVAAALAARRIITAPVGALLRRGNETATSRVALLVADAAVLVIALAGLYQLSAGGVLNAGKPNPLSALAPTFLALAVSVVGLRLVPFGARAVVAATRESRRLVPFLALRQILRRANSTRLALLLAVAIALATLAVTTWSVSGTNRDIRGLNEAGASRVLSVTGPKTGDLEDAVDRADPSGKYAMAVEILPVSNTQLIAMQTQRMPGIAAWRRDYAAPSLAQVMQTLDPPLPAPLTVTGQTVHVDLTVAALTPGVPLTANLLVSQSNHTTLGVDLGRLQPGRHVYTAQLPPGCSAGCRVAQFGLGTLGAYQPPFDPSKPQYQPTAQLTLTSISGDRPSAAAKGYFTDPGKWRQGGSGGSLQLSRGDGGLNITAQPDGGTTSWPALLPNDLPDHLPGVVGPETASVYPGGQIHDIAVLGLDGNSVPVNGKIVAKILPQLGLSGTIADLSLVHREMTGPEASGVMHQVWLAADAPSDIEQKLEKAGLHITGSDTQARHRAELDRSGPAYADTVFLLAAFAATVLAIGAAVLAALVTARRRSYELAALEAVGVRPRTLRWASAAEQGILIGLGVLFGLIAGIGGSSMALPSTPVFTDPNNGPPIEYALPWARLLVLIAVVVVVLAAICVLMARAIEGQASAARLRETQ